MSFCVHFLRESRDEQGNIAPAASHRLNRAPDDFIAIGFSGNLLLFVPTLADRDRELAGTFKL